MDQKPKQQQNTAFVFPTKLSKRVKKLQVDMEAKSTGEVLLKAISLLELVVGRKIELQDEDNEKWEIDQFKDYRKTVDIHNK